MWTLVAGSAWCTDLRVSLQTSFPCLLTVMGQREPGEKLPTPPASEVPMLTQFQLLPQLIGARILILREILMGPDWEGCHPLVQLAWTSEVRPLTALSSAPPSVRAGAWTGQGGEGARCAVQEPPLRGA